MASKWYIVPAKPTKLTVLRPHAIANHIILVFIWFEVRKWRNHCLKPKVKVGRSVPVVLGQTNSSLATYLGSEYVPSLTMSGFKICFRIVVKTLPATDILYYMQCKYSLPVCNFGMGQRKNSANSILIPPNFNPFLPILN